MNENINKILNQFLYEQKDSKEENYDIKIFKTLSLLLDNNFDSDFLLNKMNVDNKNINFTYNFNSTKSYNEYFDKFGLYYSGGNWSETKYGLQRSQLKTLTALRQCISNNNNIIPINGAPGTGKSTMLNYVISNILIGDMLKQYRTLKKKFKDVDIKRFLLTQFEIPKIFLTGQTKNAVNNVCDISKIHFPKQHKWIFSQNKKNIDVLENLFNSLDIHIPEESDDKLSDILKKYSLKEIDVFEICNNFKSYASLYFKENITWEQIPIKLFNKLMSNTDLIKEINDTIKESIENIAESKIKFYTNSLILINKFYNFFNYKNPFKYDKKNSELIVNELFIEYKELLNFIHENFMINIEQTFVKHTKKFLQKIEKIKNKPKKLYKYMVKSVSEISGLQFFWKNFNDAKIYFQKLNNYFNNIQKIFNKEELQELFLDKKIDVVEELTDETLANVMMLLDIYKINFNNIQEKLDIKYRTENSFLFRHICEWICLEKMLSSNDIEKEQNKILSYIKPIISSNLQDFNWFGVIKKLLSKKNKNNNECFDYVIIDEASQVSWKYIPFILYCFKRIIVVGDEKQLPAINDNSEIIKRIKDFDINESKEIKKILKDLELFDLDRGLPIHNSILEWANHVSKIKSTISIDDFQKEKSTEQKGLYLLEHMRCPLHMYKLFNNFFYENTLTYNREISNCKCSISKNVNISCEQATYLQLTYFFDKSIDIKNNTNIHEIKIALNFIFDNIQNFISHKFGNESNINEETIKYLNKNLYFISFYNNQNVLFKQCIDLIDEYLNSYLSDSNFIHNFNLYTMDESTTICLNVVQKIIEKYDFNELKFISQFCKNIKYGTVDATQGIGSDFIIFSNVSENVYHKDKKYLIDFENNANRINVLWSRSKHHFIQIISNKYMDTKEKINKEKLSNESKLGFKGRSFAEVFISDEFNRIVFDINFKNLNNNLSIQNLWLSNSYKNDISDLNDKIIHIGKHGETIFNLLTNDKVFSKMLSNKVKKELGLDINFYKNVKWENEEKESSKEFDFSINNEDFYVDIKSSINNGKNVFLSKREEKFAKNNDKKYFIVKINDISKFNLNIRNRSSLFFILNKISFYKFDNHKFSNNLGNVIEYELR